MKRMIELAAVLLMIAFPSFGFSKDQDWQSEQRDIDRMLSVQSKELDERDLLTIEVLLVKHKINRNSDRSLAESYSEFLMSIVAVACRLNSDNITEILAEPAWIERGGVVTNCLAQRGDHAADVVVRLYDTPGNATQVDLVLTAVKIVKQGPEALSVDKRQKIRGLLKRASTNKDPMVQTAFLYEVERQRLTGDFRQEIKTISEKSTDLNKRKAMSILNDY